MFGFTGHDSTRAWRPSDPVWCPACLVAQHEQVDWPALVPAGEPQLCAQHGERLRAMSAQGVRTAVWLFGLCAYARRIAGREPPGSKPRWW